VHDGGERVGQVTLFQRVAQVDRGGVGRGVGGRWCLVHGLVYRAVLLFSIVSGRIGLVATMGLIGIAKA